MYIYIYYVCEQGSMFNLYPFCQGSACLVFFQAWTKRPNFARAPADAKDSYQGPCDLGGLMLLHS